MRLVYLATFAFISSLPCLHTFWHAIPTFFYIFTFLYNLDRCLLAYATDKQDYVTDLLKSF